LKHSLISQRNICKKKVHDESIVLATYTVVEVTAKDECPFTGSEIVRRCFLTAVRGASM
jgi:hypothetical protein